MHKIYSSLLALAIVIMSTNTTVKTESFKGREGEMNANCSVAHDKSLQGECSAYKDYLVQKSKDLKNQISSIDNETNKVRGKLDETRKLVEKNNEEIQTLTNDINQTQTILSTLEGTIQELNNQVESKQESMQGRDELLRKRLLRLQVYTGSNYFLDFLMGAQDFTDILRRSEVVNELDAYEKEQIQLLMNERAVLNEQKDDVENKKALHDVQMASLEDKRTLAESLKKSNEDLAAEYRAQESELTREKALAQVASGEVVAAIPTISSDILPDSFKPINPGNPDNGDGEGTGDDGNNDNGGGGSGPSLSDSFIFPILGKSYYSAGTWAYSSGLEHIGADFGTYSALGLSVVAPASGIVVATYDGVANHGVNVNGTLSPNKWAGIPAGGGNTLHMITEVGGVTYGISFYHLSPGQFNISAGSIVSQGQLMAHTGHSGNSSGPHCHIEVIRLGYNGIQAGMDLFYARGKDYGYGLWSPSKACSVTGTTPCLERPEKFFN